MVGCGKSDVAEVPVARAHEEVPVARAHEEVPERRAVPARAAARRARRDHPGRRGITRRRRIPRPWRRRRRERRNVAGAGGFAGAKGAAGSLGSIGAWASGHVVSLAPNVAVHTAGPSPALPRIRARRYSCRGEQDHDQRDRSGQPCGAGAVLLDGDGPAAQRADLPRQRGRQRRLQPGRKAVADRRPEEVRLVDADHLRDDLGQSDLHGPSHRGCYLV